MFKEPPDSARPMTWMHMMNNNASKEGLTKDLEGLAEAGVGGALIFSVKKGVADGRVMFNSKEWRDILTHGVKEADRLGLKIGVHNCDGWSSSGGPWVPVEDAMKQVVCSDTVVQGGGGIDMHLPKPVVHSGFYRDIAVVAYPATEQELQAHGNQPSYTASAAKADIEQLLDGQLDTEAMFAVNRKTKEKPWLVMHYERPFTARSIHVGHRSRNGEATLYASQDGQNYDKIVHLKPSFRTGKIYWAYEASFPEVSARYFKLVFDGTIVLTSVDLAPFRRLPAWLGQTALARKSDGELQSLSMPPASEFIPLDAVRVVTRQLPASGRCQTTLPEGTWRILRFGYTITGAYNHPATDSGRGWECDKLDAKALDRHFAAYMGKLVEAAGPLAGQSLFYSEVDSYEMGGQNWTGGFESIFEQDKGYDLIPLLPLVVGRMIGSPSTADAVLGDFRHVLGQLWIKNYFQRFTDLCHQHGLQAYNEPYGNASFDNLTAGGTADIPMGEFWLDSDRYMVGSAVNAAHTYGKPVISAESFTSWQDLNWKVHPWLMKRSGDTAWIKGINEFMFHRFAHQANPHVLPGMTMDSIGSHIDRTQTWWLNAGKAWMKYLQRGSWLLRQGVPVSDLLVYVGEGTPHSEPSRSRVKLPYGYNMDLCDNYVLLNRLRVQDGKLVLPEGTTYQRLLLTNSEQMSLKTLHRVEELVQAGATIIGTRPVEPIGYLERLDQQARFKYKVDALWGQGLVIEDSYWQDNVNSQTLTPDLLIAEEPQAEFIHRQVDHEHLYFFQNKEAEPRVLNVSFRISGYIPELWHADTGKIESCVEFTERQERTELSVSLDAHGSVFVIFRKPVQTLDTIKTITDPCDQAHVVMEKTGCQRFYASYNGTYRIERHSGKQEVVKITDISKPKIIEGPWQVCFDGLGLSESPHVLTYGKLSDWKDDSCPEIQYFSGTAAYRKSIQLDREWLTENKRIWLDLGQVHIAAEVIINGQNLGCLWKPPFKTDITDAIHAGKNDLLIKVTNQWTNRLIGDENLEKNDGYKRYTPMPEWYVKNEPMPAGPRSTFCTFNFYSKDRELLPSGLLGPVRLVQEAVVSITRCD